jgi:hypothetical protein
MMIASSRVIYFPGESMNRDLRENGRVPTGTEQCGAYYMFLVLAADQVLNGK